MPQENIQTAASTRPAPWGMVQYGPSTPTHSADLGTIYIAADGSDVDDRVFVNIDGSTTWTYLTAGT